MTWQDWKRIKAIIDSSPLPMDITAPQCETDIERLVKILTIAQEEVAALAAKVWDNE